MHRVILFAHDALAQNLIKAHNLPIVLEQHSLTAWRKMPKKVQIAFIKTQDAWVFCDDGVLRLMGADMHLNPNFIAQKSRILKSGKRTEALLQALSPAKEDTVIDATAGLGRESLIIARHCHKVIMIERHALLAWMLLHSRARLMTDADFGGLMQKLDIHFGDSVHLLPHIDAQRVYLDPMFPKDSYKAQVKKPMQTLSHLLAKESSSGTDLLTAARASGRFVLVKRPPDAPFLTDVAPTRSLHYPALRFDVYL